MLRVLRVLQRLFGASRTSVTRFCGPSSRISGARFKIIPEYDEGRDGCERRRLIFAAARSLAKKGQT